LHDHRVHWRRIASCGDYGSVSIIATVWLFSDTPAGAHAKEQLVDELFQKQPSMLASFLVQKQMGVSFEKMEFLLARTFHKLFARAVLH
jgi:hypothetical protein